MLLLSIAPLRKEFYARSKEKCHSSRVPNGALPSGKVFLRRDLLCAQRPAVRRTVLYGLPDHPAFSLASLDGAAAPTHEIWMWAAVTIGSIVLGIVLSVIGSFSCHACAFNALYDLRMRLLDHMGRLNLGFYTGGQSGATQKMMNENIEKMENIIAHDVSNIFGAGLLLAALAVLMFSLNIPLALTIFIALVLAFLIQFSAFGGKQGQKIWSDLNRSSTELDAAFSEYVAGMEEEKIFGQT